MLFASCVFFIGSLLCGMATNLWALVIARAIAGIGGGGINWYCISLRVCHYRFFILAELTRILFLKKV